MKIFLEMGKGSDMHILSLEGTIGHFSYQRIWEAQIDSYSLALWSDYRMNKPAVLTTALSQWLHWMVSKKKRFYICSCLVSVENFLYSRMLQLPGSWCSLHDILGKLKHTTFHSPLVWTTMDQESIVHCDLLKLKIISNLYAFLSVWTYLCYHVLKQHESFLTSVHLISIN